MNDLSSICCNTRNLSSRLSGVQRYTYEILSRLASIRKINAPQTLSHGLLGHAWEQVALPFELNGETLWSPANTGPLSVRRQVVTIHDLSTIDHPEWTSKRFSSWYKFLIPKLTRRACRILTVSEYTKDRLIYYVPEAIDKVFVTPLAADPRFSPVDSLYIRSVVSNLSLPSFNYILAVGSIEPRKNLLTVLKAWESILNKMPQDVWLFIAGAPGWAHIFGTQIIYDLPCRVHFLGYVPDEFIPALYSGALASVYMSSYEGFGLPPLEAMSCGTPVLVSNSTSLPEVVGDAGLMVDPFDTEAIGDGLIRLVEDSALRQNLRSLGLARSKQFSWDNTAQQTWQVLEEAARQ